MKKKNELKVVLCTTPNDVKFDRSKGELPMPPKIAIVSLIKWMEKASYKGDFFDIDMLIPTKKEIYDYFLQNRPDVVGISSVVSTSYLQAKQMSRLIRKACPDAMIVIGGNMAVSANILLRKTEIDFCVLGDGEMTLVNLLDYARINGRKKIDEKLKKIKGIAFINKDNEMEFTGYGEPIPDKENPYPDYDLLAKGLLSKPYLVNNYFRKGKESTNWFAKDPRSFEPGRKPNMAMAWVGKGCVSRCTFCQRFCKGYHLFDLKKFEEHIKELKNRHDVQYFILTGENFGLPRDFAYDVAKILKKHGMLWFAGGARCTNFRPEDYKFFRECGCIGIKFGVESGSQKILDIMEKMFTVEQLTAALKVAADNGMLAPLSLCIGMPGETDDTIMQTGRFIGEISRMQGIPPLDVAVFYALPLPGAVLYEYGQLQGVIGTEPDEEEQYLTYVSDRDSDRTNYVNLTGIKTRKALFWEHMIFYEANRVFYSSPPEKKTQAPESQKTDINNDMVPKRESVGKMMIRVITKNPRILLTAMKSPFSYLNGVMCRSRFATKIPRSIIYPVMRNLIYLEYSINLFFRRIAGLITNDSWNKLDMKFKRKRCSNLITTNESLRKINSRIRATMPAPATLTEKNQILLYQGR